MLDHIILVGGFNKWSPIPTTIVYVEVFLSLYDF